MQQDFASSIVIPGVLVQYEIGLCLDWKQLGLIGISPISEVGGIFLGYRTLPTTTGQRLMVSYYPNLSSATIQCLEIIQNALTWLSLPYIKYGPLSTNTTSLVVKALVTGGRCMLIVGPRLRHGSPVRNYHMGHPSLSTQDLFQKCYNKTQKLDFGVFSYHLE